MALPSVEALAPLVNLTLAVLFAGTLFMLARLHGRVAAMRGAQAELRGLLRACSDAVDGAERSVTSLRQAAQNLAGDLGRTMDEAESLRVEIDRTCAAASQALERLGPLVREEVASPPPAPPAPTQRTQAGPVERAAMRLFRETIRGL
ncbi:DUF6468 domain-containing protein [Niveispirillum sp. KHB5.9]|uniref:DUF6468 domain-containing protein n=1 Tax=Niveispirillum sp. KHB5.9 TaxID=3400269 RepID=UPI003A8712EF